eukprot:m.25131 g.25131  ORF g.25131 m.25131 type:complete len:697 (-) comp8680_c0_seq2:5873-7963(-)
MAAPPSVLQAPSSMVGSIECAQILSDTPDFRVKIHKQETELISFAAQLQHVTESCESMAHKGTSYHKAHGKFVSDFRLLKDLPVFNDNALVEQSVDTFCDLLVELENSRLLIMEQARNVIVESFKHEVAQRVNPIVEFRKTFKDISERLDQARSKLAAVSAVKSKPGDVEEAEKLVVALKATFDHTAVDYVKELHSVHENAPRPVCDSALSLLHTHVSAAKLASDLTNDVKPKLVAISDMETQRAQTASTNEKHFERRHSIANHVRRHTKSQRVRTGYLFKRSSSTFKTWQWRFFSLDQAAGKLMYTHRDQMDWKPFVDDLRLCSVKVARTEITDRRFCFELVTPSKSFLLQALSAQDRDDWIVAIQDAIGQALKTVTPVAKSSTVPRSMSLTAPPQLTMDDVPATSSAQSAQSEPTDVEKDRTQHRQILQRSIHEVEGNEVCADCHAPNPTWASINLGVAICIKCSGIHRSLGSHLSKVRSLQLDRLDVPICRVMLLLGNTAINSVLEAKDAVKPGKDSSAQEMETFIRAKYETKIFRGDLPDPMFLLEGLFEAACDGDVMTVQTLILLGVDINFKREPDGMSALMLACAHKQPVVVQLLLLHNADKDAQDEKGQTPAHICAALGVYDCLCLLIKNKADTSIQDSTGSTPEQVALEHQHADALTLLRLAVFRQAGHGSGNDGDINAWLEMGLNLV